ncbi:hypothetical protein F5Y06DRAFT_234717 [Hypoxylon sp. FL0890]|nr:hypothetical protein F5Y06DRAFT_234717 [Hypoxylon sp. FL0890]
MSSQKQNVPSPSSWLTHVAQQLAPAAPSCILFKSTAGGITANGILSCLSSDSAKNLGRFASPRSYCTFDRVGLVLVIAERWILWLRVSSSYTLSVRDGTYPASANKLVPESRKRMQEVTDPACWNLLPGATGSGILFRA